MYNLNWKKYTGENIDSVASYIKEWIDSNPHGNIIVGCDSQKHSKYVKYSVSIAMHMIDEFGIGHGAHVIFANHHETAKHLKHDIRAKLDIETFITLEVVNEITPALGDVKSKLSVHLDYNSDPKYYSNKLYENLGYFTGMGIKAFGKPNAYVASHASDALCKNKQAKGVH